MLREIRATHAIDPGSSNLVVVAAKMEPRGGAIGEPRHARPPPRRRREERLDPARRFAGGPAVPGRDGGAGIRGARHGRVEDLREQQPERPEVGRGTRLTTLTKLRRRISRRATKRARRTRRDFARQPEIDERRPAILRGIARRRGRRMRRSRSADHVRRLDVAVMEARLVELFESARDGVSHHGGEHLALVTLSRIRAGAGGEAGQTILDAHAVDPLRHEKARTRVEQGRAPSPRHSSEEERLPQDRRRGAGDPLLRPLEGCSAPARLRMAHQPDHGGRPLPDALENLPGVAGRAGAACSARSRRRCQLLCRIGQRDHFPIRQPW